MALVLYKTSDRIKIDIAGVVLQLSPLSFDQKVKITSCYRMESGEMIPDAVKQTFLAVKYSVKLIEGIQLQDGSNYQVSYEKDGDLDVLTDECASDLLNLPISIKLMTACGQLLNGVNEDLGKMPGIKLLEGPGVKKSKKK